jgi:hypothetical protein
MDTIATVAQTRPLTRKPAATARARLLEPLADARLIIGGDKRPKAIPIEAIGIADIQ